MGLISSFLNSLKGNNSSKSTNTKSKKTTTNKSTPVKPNNTQSQSRSTTPSVPSSPLTQTVTYTPTAPKIDVTQLTADKRKYSDLKTNIESIIRYLNSAISNLETPSNRISDLYNIDSVAIDYGRLNSIKQNLIEKRNYLTNVVLIELDENIKKINERIG